MSGHIPGDESDQDIWRKDFEKWTVLRQVEFTYGDKFCAIYNT